MGSFKKIYIFSGWIPSSILIYSIVYYVNPSIDLSANKIINPVLFFILTFVGIYFCFSLVKLLLKSRKLSSFFSIIDKNSMHIMALHFLVIKVIDVIYSKIHMITDVKIITKFPYSFDIWYYCIPIAILVPVVIVSLPKFFERKKELL